MKFSKIEKILRITSLLYAVCFVFTALVFLFAPDLLFRYINLASAHLFPSLPGAADTGKFWLSMTVSMMAGVTAASVMIYINVRENYKMAVPLFVMKFASSVCGAAFFTAGAIFPDTGWNTLANLIIFITDFPLGFFMFVLYRRICRETANK